MKWLVCLLALLGGTVFAATPPILPARGSVQVAFSPEDDAGALIVDAIRHARSQILVQAYSFTHRAIAAALVSARQRGIDVEVVADREQSETIRTSRIDYLAEHGVPVYLDGEHAAAHNKVMVIDAGQPEATVITGSFNFTSAAQYRNAENLLILRDDPTLADAYAANWRRHRAHSLPLQP